MLDFYQKQAVVNLLPLTENDLMTLGSVTLFHGQKSSLLALTMMTIQLVW